MEALIAFGRTPTLPPTSHRAERARGAPVIWRKTSFGSGSGAGLRAVERRLSVGETCRQQGRNVLHYLADALDAARAGRPAPQLRPAR